MQSISGQTIRGYQLQKKLGEGGFGAVYRAHQTSVGRDVAVKIIRPNFANRPDFIRRFEIEAQTIASLEHMHIVPLHDYWREPDGAYLVMRFLKGGSLRDALQQKGSYDVQRAGILLNQIAAALEAAHARQIIHRDIKPENILLDEDGNAYLADFGIAKNLNTQDNITAAEAIVGSLDYISPEQARSEPVTVRTDVYTLGVVLYEMMTSTHPWPELSSVERLYKHINDPLPVITGLDDVNLDSLNTVIQTATAKDPQNRYETPTLLAQAFRQEVIGTTSAENDLLELLTAREQDVLQGIIDGKSNKEIAADLFIELSTVKWYIRQVYRKLNVGSRMQAIIKGRDLNLITNTADSIAAQAVKLDSRILAQLDNPYKGLRAFTSADALDFFGRDRLVKKLVHSLAQERFLAVVGPSGSGKSSVVRAGLIPALWRGDLPRSDDWFIIEMLPGSRPLDQLEIALTRIATDQATHIGSHLRRDANGLLRCADLILPKGNSELLIVVDQFEEVFTLLEDEDERQHFLDLLMASATDARSRVRVVLTLRADFYDRPLRYADFGRMLRANMETILPLSAEELEQAIVEPAKRLGIVYEPGLVAKLVGEMNYQAGALPLLQYALTELFDRREGTQITHTAYDEIGGAVGALARRAEATYQEMSPEQRAATRQIFLRLVTLGEGVEDTRRRAPRSELMGITDNPDMMDEIIDIFGDYRLLSLDNDPETRTPTVEVAHEAILLEWERLRSWLDESRADIRLERVLAHNTDDWLEHGRDPSYLLRGSRLEQFEAWTNTTDLSLTPQERDYFETSVADRDQRIADEASRIQREATLEQQSQRALQYLTVALAILLVGAIAFALFAVDREGRTRDALTQAESARATSVYNEQQARQLALVNAARAESISGNLETGLALALAAVEMNDSNPAAQVVLAETTYEPGTAQRFDNTETVRQISLHPTEPLILTAPSFGFERALWDLQTGERIRDLSGPSDEDGMPFSTAAFSPDGETALIGRVDGVIVLYDVATGMETGRLQSDITDQVVQEIVIVGQSQQVLVTYAGFDNTGTCSGALLLWNIESGEMLQAFDVPSQCAIGLSITPDGRLATTGGSLNNTVLPEDPGLMTVWDMATGAPIMTLGANETAHSRLVVDTAITPDGTRAASLGADTNLIFWDLATGEQLARDEGVMTNFTFAKLAISPDGRTLSVTDRTDLGHTRLYSMETFELIGALSGGIDRATYSVFLPDNQRILVSGEAGEMRLYDLGYGAQIERFVLDLPPYLRDLEFGVLSRTYHLDSGRILQTQIQSVNFDAEDIPVYHVLYDERGQVIVEHDWSELINARTTVFLDANRAVTSFADDRLIVWDVMSGEELQRITLPTPNLEIRDVRGAVVMLAPNQDVAETGMPVLAVDLESGQIVSVSRDDLTMIDVSLSPDGMHLLTSTFEGSVQVWRMADGSLLTEMNDHAGSYSIIGDMDAASNTVLTYGSGEMLRWNIASGESITRYVVGPSAQFNFAWFTPEGILFDGTETRLYSESGELLRTFDAPGDIIVLSVADDGRILTQNLADRDMPYAFAWWRLDSLPELVEWVEDNRYIRELTCDERDLYNITPLCDDEGQS